jgi:hypothetical protein
VFISHFISLSRASSIGLVPVVVFPSCAWIQQPTLLVLFCFSHRGGISQDAIRAVIFLSHTGARAPGSVFARAGPPLSVFGAFATGPHSLLHALGFPFARSVSARAWVAGLYFVSLASEEFLPQDEGSTVFGHAPPGPFRSGSRFLYLGLWIEPAVVFCCPAFFSRFPLPPSRLISANFVLHAQVLCSMAGSA